MSAFVLEIIAVVSMVVDHLAVVLYGRNFPSWNMYLYMRAFGRLAFPLYCFLLVNGFEKTSNRKKVPLKACDVCGLVPDPLCHGILGYELRGDIRHNGTEL